MKKGNIKEILEWTVLILTLISLIKELFSHSNISNKRIILLGAWSFKLHPKGIIPFFI